MTGPSTEVRGGFRLDPATQAEIDHVEAHYRAGDRREMEVAGGGRTMLEEFEACWTVRAGNGDIVGYFGVLCLPGESVLGRSRGFCFMSCEAANRHKIAFVKASRPAFSWVASQCPPWVDRFVTWPLESYRGSIRWQERVLGMRRTFAVDAGGGERIVLMELTRTEVNAWQLEHS